MRREPIGVVGKGETRAAFTRSPGTLAKGKANWDDRSDDANDRVCAYSLSDKSLPKELSDEPLMLITRAIKFPKLLPESRCGCRRSDGTNESYALLDV